MCFVQLTVVTSPGRRNAGHWLGLSEDRETITDIQVMDAARLGRPARAELRRLFRPLREGETWCAIPGLDKH